MEIRSMPAVNSRFASLLISRVAVFAILILLGWCSSSHAALVAYWNFDEGTGTNVFDLAGNTTRTNNGFFGSPSEAPSWVPGRLGGALSFAWVGSPTAAGKRVVVPYHTNLTLNGPFTISYWYRMDAATPSGTFPGIMRLGSQSATTGNNVGWGFFRTGNMVYKRGNNQPTLFGAMNVGQWYHLAITWNGNTNAGINNTTGYLNGVAVPLAAVNGWSNVTATTIFEMGRMDAFDTATLDELALWGNEALSPAKVRSIYTVPTSINLDYNIADMRVLWNTFDAGPGTTNAVKGLQWAFTSTLPGSTTPGDSYLFGPNLYVVLGPGTGVTAPLTFLSGLSSPAGIGTLGTFSLVGNPITLSNANVLFDLGLSTTVGGGVNDLIDITGDLNIVNSSVSLDPLAALPPATYRLINYSGSKSGSLTISNTTRYTLALDETVTNQINLAVSGTNASLKWSSTNSGSWDLISTNWTNLTANAADIFYQGDSVLFDDSAAFQTNINVLTPVFVSSMTVTTATRPYNFIGSGIGGGANGIIKQGASALILSTPNTFIGDVQVKAGTLKLGNGTALGTTNGQTIVSAGATLDLAGINPGTEDVTAEGDGVNGAGAIINTGAALSNNGLRGRVTFTGNTTFGGVNRWDVFGGRLFANGFKLTKVGGPEIALSNLGDTGLGDVNVVQGILTILGNTTLGDPAKTLTVSNNAVLAFWQTAPTVLNKPIVMGPGAILRNATSGNTDITTNLGTVSITGDANMQATANIALLGVVSGSGNVVKANTGTLYLGGSNTYSGNTIINAGRLAILDGGSINSSPTILLPAGSFFDVTRVTGGYALATNQTLSGSGTVAGSLIVPPGALVSPGGQSVPATLTISNDFTLSGGALSFEIAASTVEGSGVNDLINVNGNLNLTGTSSITINPLGLLTVGNTYTLINYVGTLSGGTANLAIINNTHYSFVLSTAVPGKVSITVTGGAAAQLGWLGGTAGAETLWDVRTTPNWSDPLGNPVTFYGGDQVVFDDFGFFFPAAPDIAPVDLVGTLTPATVRLENGSLDYVFSGFGKLSGNSTLTKVFGGRATIANSNVNDYIGATLIQGGTLQIGNGGVWGNIGSGPITNNATLAYNRRDTITFANVLGGTGTFFKQNTNLMIFSGNNPGYDGTITATNGIIRPTITNGLGSPVGGTIIGSGATLDVNAVNLGDEPVTAGGAGFGGSGAIINSSATGQNNAMRFLTLTDNTTVGGTGRWDVRANPTGSLLTGGNPYNLTKVGANQVSFVDLNVDPALGDIFANAGTLSMELSSAAGDPTKTLTVASNATVQFWARTVPWAKKAVLNGGRNILVGNGNATMSGPVTLNGPVLFEDAGTSLTIDGIISGSGSLIKTGAAPVVVTMDNTYAGGTRIAQGVLQLGLGDVSGSILNSIVNNGILSIYRGDAYTLTNPISGTGGIYVRTTNGLTLGTTPINLPAGTISVGQTSQGLLIIPSGITVTANSIFLGDSSGISGDTIQLGGTVTVTNQMRVGHWPSGNISTYLMGGGTLSLTATPAGVVNQNAVAEQAGILYLGIDGTGTFTQTGGVASAHGIVLDGRGNTTAGGTGPDAGIDTFTLLGGRFNIGPSGIKSGNFDANTSIAIRLGGGTIGSSANWTSVLAMTLTGNNGNTTIDTGNFTNTLSGSLSGTGGLIKTGAGTLALSGAAAYGGGSVVSQGLLLARGTVGNGSGTVTVNGGTLGGDGAINDAVVVNAGGTIAPGLSVGQLTVNNTVTLGGTTVMEIGKSATGLTNDYLAAGSALTYGGTLTVVASGTALAGGDTFKLFNAGTYSGAFTTLNLPALPGNLTWDVSQLAVNGTIRVGQPVPTIAFSSTRTNISLTWNSAFADFTLQAQTNAPGIGIQSNNWVTLTNITNTSVTFDIDKTNGSVFYRLIKP